MKKLMFLAFLFTFLNTEINSQSVGINETGESPDESAILHVKSSSKGVILPRLWQSDIDNIVDPAIGLIVFRINDNNLVLYNGTEWKTVGDVGPFIKDDLAIRQRIISTETDFIIGRDSLPKNGQDIDGHTRMLFFDKQKGALRAGRVTQFDWGPDSLGQSSIGLGQNVKAKGTYSFSTGTQTEAIGLASSAFGYKTRAASGYEFVLGNYNTLYSPNNPEGWHPNDRLFVIGNGSSIERNDALVINKNGNTTLDGKLTLTDGTDPFTLPDSDGDNGEVLMSNGNGTISWQPVSASDNDPDPTNEIQTLTKSGSTILLSDGGGSVIDDIGPLEENTNTVRLIDPTHNLLIGRDDMPVNGSNITDDFLVFDNSKSSFRFGRVSNSDVWSPENTGSFSLASGYNPKALGSGSVAFGNTTLAEGVYSLVGGFRTIAPSAYEVAFGRYNTDYLPLGVASWNSNDRIFVIGNGTSTANRKDALSILKNGNTTIYGTLTLEDDGDAVTFPASDGTTNEILKTDGGGNLTWQPDEVDDADASPTNELQDLSLSGTLLSITNGTNVDLDDFAGKWSSGSNSDIYRSGGSVGIGTSTAPTEKLLVYQNGNENAMNITNVYNGAAIKRGLYVDISIGGTGDKVGISTLVSAGSSNSTIGVSGYVNAGSSGVHRGVYGSASGAGIGVEAQAFDANGIALKASGPSHLEGDVVIGTDETIGKLHVHDPDSDHAKMYLTPNPTFDGNSSLFFGEDDDASLSMEWRYNGSSSLNTMELYGHSNNNQYGPHLRIKRNNGQVAIGNDFAVGYQLSVDGKVACEEVLVELSGDWPDYVFEENYNLKSIEALESYIKKEKHLPGIAPANQIESDGLQIGETQRILTEKIEELTLYIIQLNKENKELKERMLALENQGK